MTSGSQAATPAQPRLRLEADTRRDQILIAAQQLFAERPYEAVSLLDIAEKAGTTRTNIYYHFRTKRDLFLEIVRRFSEIPVTAEPAAAEQGSTERRVRVVLGRWLDAVEQNREMFMTLLNATSSTDPQVAGVLVESLQAWENRLLLVVGLEQSNPTHHAMVKAYQAMIAAATLSWLEDRAMTKEQLHKMLSNTLLTLGELA
ncbi:TetR/AcrR family transcriptional regulator [Nocardioides sp.]|uniref:TetR/AcrR family transcriptional regulator n=1 Tax=Nocardioides sp. TaxID=35761 RepID=UPI00262BEE90|nr:TetR/AcrR family transcriptional regulator [Nocardioides sp.]MDI6909235.1 helix-turn-helix domain-containing protein [Nocardioides sp.]